MSDDTRAHGLPPFPPDYRASGLLLHVTSLPSPYGIGDVGPAALKWIDQLHEAGQCWWQALPLGPTGYGNSPYQSMSSFVGNGLLISPDWLIEDGLLSASDCTAPSFKETAVGYGMVIPFKHRLFERAWSNFSAGAPPELKIAFEQFCQDQAHWLEDYALFRVLKSRYNGAYHLEWPEELLKRVPAALAQARRDLASHIDLVRFAQFLLFRQGERLKGHACAKGVRLIGDLPFFVSPDSSDVWANPELFLLDKQQRPSFVAGVPPDYFSSEGQLWGNPVYNWEALRQTGYRWCIDRMRALLAHVDVIRLDHFRGFAAGPTLCFRGLDNSTYYILDKDRARYANYSGTGNTLNANHPIVRRLIVDSLRYWVEEMHVDGFRFDLAAILGRDESGQVMQNPPVLWDIESDPSLAGTKLIAEAWDAAGLYQVGSFIGDSWKEWNGRFRDDVRGFLRGEEGAVGRFADRLLGSPAIYGHKEREAEESVNFVTCHDGFTLNDLVSYDHKHNEANGEDNRDGANDNRSWNCGVEGPTDDPRVEKLRKRQVKNFLTVTMLSVGMPMILMGDEVRRTQLGNNNAYCQDNETSWFDWTLLAKHADVHRFVTLLNARRLVRALEPEGQRVCLNQLLRGANFSWHGVKLGQPDWGETSHSIAFTMEIRNEELLYHLIFNAYWQPLDFELPRVNKAGENPWRRWIDTALDSPHDILQWNAAESVHGYIYRAEARSVVLLFAGV